MELSRDFLYSGAGEYSYSAIALCRYRFFKEDSCFSSIGSAMTNSELLVARSRHGCLPAVDPFFNFVVITPGTFVIFVLPVFLVTLLLGEVLPRLARLGSIFHPAR